MLGAGEGRKFLVNPGLQIFGQEPGILCTFAAAKLGIGNGGIFSGPPQASIGDTNENKRFYLARE